MKNGPFAIVVKGSAMISNAVSGPVQLIETNLLRARLRAESRPSIDR